MGYNIKFRQSGKNHIWKRNWKTKAKAKSMIKKVLDVNRKAKSLGIPIKRKITKLRIVKNR